MPTTIMALVSIIFAPRLFRIARAATQEVMAETYIEAARTTYLRRVSGIQGVRDMAMILARAEVDYRLPVLISDRLEAEVRAVAIGTKSFTLAYRLWVTRDGARLLVAESRTVLVCYDYPNERSVPVPPDLIAGLESFEGRSLRKTK